MMNDEKIFRAIFWIFRLSRRSCHTGRPGTLGARNAAGMRASRVFRRIIPTGPWADTRKFISLL